jgi:DNA-binding MarR family transcriptional regulator
VARSTRQRRLFEALFRESARRPAFTFEPLALYYHPQCGLNQKRRRSATSNSSSCCQEIHARSGRDVSINAVYTTLDRLESKGFLRSWIGEPTHQRGGRRRKFYALRSPGAAALRQAYRAFTAMADGLEGRLEAK